jgi:uncharacterized coiled-coil protein SlyX
MNPTHQRSTDPGFPHPRKPHVVAQSPGKVFSVLRMAPQYPSGPEHVVCAGNDAVAQFFSEDDARLRKVEERKSMTEDRITELRKMAASSWGVVSIECGALDECLDEIGRLQGENSELKSELKAWESKFPTTKCPTKPPTPIAS